MRSKNLISPAAAGLVLCFAAGVSPCRAAQAPAFAPENVGARAVWRESYGLGYSGTELFANGPDYRARLDAHGVEYTPAFGSRAPQSYPARFELIGWQRDVGALNTSAPDQPELQGLRAVYERGFGVQEHMTARRDGIELSYVFAQKPQGSGDLIVRLAIGSELGRYGDARELALHAPGFGAITIGAVTGIGADGERVAGALRFVGSELELSLPAEFVERAAYPLVLDPVIGVEFEVDSDASDLYDDVSPAIAHDATNGNYLIVWCRAFSISDTDIRGQRVTDAGALVGGLVGIESGTTVSQMATDPAVGNSNLLDTYFIAWESSTGLFSTRDIKVRALPAISTGSPSATAPSIASTSANEDNPAIGGDPSLTSGEVMVVWSEAGSGIRAIRVTTFFLGEPASLVPLVEVSDASTTSWEDYSPAISKSCGYGNNFLIAWERYFSSPATPYYDIRYALVDRDAALLVGTTALTSSSATSETHVRVAGDGLKFAVVYQQEPAAGGNVGIYGNRVSYLGGATGNTGAQVTLFDSVFNESEPDICLTGDSMVLAYVGTSILSSNSPIEFRSLDPIDLQQCGTTGFFSDSNLDYAFPVLSSAAESYLNSNGDVVCAVQARESSSAAGEIWVQRYSPVVGLNTEITGSCGGGRTEVGCLLSTDTVRVHVCEAPKSLPVWLILSPQALDMAIGGCTLWADPFAGWIFSSGTTDNLGEAHFTIPITANPGLIGVQFHAQHALQSASGPVSFGTGGPSFFISTAVLCTFE